MSIKYCSAKIGSDVWLWQVIFGLVPVNHVDSSLPLCCTAHPVNHLCILYAQRQIDLRAYQDAYISFDSAPVR